MLPLNLGIRIPKEDFVFKVAEICEELDYIKPQNYEISKTRKYKTAPYSVENMVYDPKKDEYTCPNGRKAEVPT